MASKLSFLLVLVAALVLRAMAKSYVVGDDKGWMLNFDYQEWAKDKEFQLGDQLVFKYKEGAHNVYRVDGTGFKNCAAPDESEALTSGNDVITLSGPGKKWYICGVGNHCEDGGMKLAINVLNEQAQSSASEITLFGYQALIVAAIAIATLVMV